MSRAAESVSDGGAMSGEEGGMYLAVRRYQAAPGSVGEVARLVREGFVPVVGAIPGLVGYYVADIGDGEVLAVNVFRDREGAEESNRLAGEWANEHLARLLAVGGVRSWMT